MAVEPEAPKHAQTSAASSSRHNTGRKQMNLKMKSPLFGADRLMPFVLLLFAILSIMTTVGIVVILVTESLGFFREISPWEFLTGTEWHPLFAEPKFGVLPLIGGTLMVTLIASVVALPIGMFSAIYLSEYAPDRVRSVLKPVLEILAGVPTIVYGFFALNFVTPIIKYLFPQTDTFNALSAGIVVGIMIIPLISSLSEDAMSAVPKPLRNAAYALGATKLEVAWKVVLPASLSGVIASFVLGLSRAIGETMIVALAAGAMPNLSWNPLESMETLTAYIVAVSGGDTQYGSVEYRTIYAVGITLFVMTLLMNILAGYISRRFREEYK